MENTKRRKSCCNCVFGGTQFKIANKTHLHCEDERQFPKEKFESGELCAWDSLMEFGWKCDNHEFKPLKNKTI